MPDFAQRGSSALLAPIFAIMLGHHINPKEPVMVYCIMKSKVIDFSGDVSNERVIIPASLGFCKSKSLFTRRSRKWLAAQVIFEIKMTFSNQGVLSFFVLIACRDMSAASLRHLLLLVRLLLFPILTSLSCMTCCTKSHLRSSKKQMGITPEGSKIFQK